MKWAALALAILGFATGTMFRLSVLLPILLLLLLLSIVFTIASGLSFLQAVLTVIVVQIIVQSSYFAGLLARAIVAGPRHW